MENVGIIRSAVRAIALPDRAVGPTTTRLYRLRKNAGLEKKAALSG
jgi:hypothetical protein